jgi:mannose-6-phosphate isomerase-like protein (cupin superfamily)
MADNKYESLIKKGVFSPLGNVPFHKDAPLKRLLMQDHGTFPDLSETSPGASYRIAVHVIDVLPQNVPEYVDSHSHDCDEINLILSEKGKLVYYVVLGDEEYTVTSPATIYIPKEVRHKIWAKEGQGTFIAIIMSKEYQSSLIVPAEVVP